VEALAEVVQVLIEEQALEVVEQQRLELIILHQLLLQEVVQELQLQYQEHQHLILVVEVVELMLIVPLMVQEQEQREQGLLAAPAQLVKQQQILVVLQLIQVVVQVQEV
tara:strand:- start:80 stop:406 length:327 start_codon:yes stop_codon:yes gene_type:complete